MFKQKSDPTAATAPIDAVQQARTRARQRLIGAIVLLAIGMIYGIMTTDNTPSWWK